ncbi:unnamed protein product [Amoebophrya sp. A25]|nr:unnamed protein product [Amoebophrya sp. A25]|eukprot:GSA25T00026748001.1
MKVSSTMRQLENLADTLKEKDLEIMRLEARLARQDRALNALRQQQEDTELYRAVRDALGDGGLRHGTSSDGGVRTASTNHHKEVDSHLYPMNGQTGTNDTLTDYRTRKGASAGGRGSGFEAVATSSGFFAGRPDVDHAVVHDDIEDQVGGSDGNSIENVVNVRDRHDGSKGGASPRNEEHLQGRRLQGRHAEKYKSVKNTPALPPRLQTQHSFTGGGPGGPGSASYSNTSINYPNYLVPNHLGGVASRTQGSKSTSSTAPPPLSQIFAPPERFGARVEQEIGVSTKTRYFEGLGLLPDATGFWGDWKKGIGYTSARGAQAHNDAENHKELREESQRSCSIGRQDEDTAFSPAVSQDVVMNSVDEKSTNRPDSSGLVQTESFHSHIALMVDLHARFRYLLHNNVLNRESASSHLLERQASAGICSGREEASGSRKEKHRNKEGQAVLDDNNEHRNCDPAEANSDDAERNEDAAVVEEDDARNADPTPAKIDAGGASSPDMEVGGATKSPNMEGSEDRGVLLDENEDYLKIVAEETGDQESSAQEVTQETPRMFSHADALSRAAFVWLKSNYLREYCSYTYRKRLVEGSRNADGEGLSVASYPYPCATARKQEQRPKGSKDQHHEVRNSVFTTGNVDAEIDAHTSSLLKQEQHVEKVRKVRHPYFAHFQTQRSDEEEENANTLIPVVTQEQNEKSQGRQGPHENAGDHPVPTRTATGGPPQTRSDSIAASRDGQQLSRPPHGSVQPDPRNNTVALDPFVNAEMQRFCASIVLMQDDGLMPRQLLENFEKSTPSRESENARQQDGGRFSSLWSIAQDAAVAELRALVSGPLSDEFNLPPDDVLDSLELVLSLLAQVLQVPRSLLLEQRGTMDDERRSLVDERRSLVDDERRSLVDVERRSLLDERRSSTDANAPRSFPSRNNIHMKDDVERQAGLSSWDGPSLAEFVVSADDAQRFPSLETAGQDQHQYLQTRRQSDLVGVPPFLRSERAPPGSRQGAPEGIIRHEHHGKVESTESTEQETVQSRNGREISDLSDDDSALGTDALCEAVMHCLQEARLSKAEVEKFDRLLEFLNIHMAASDPTQRLGRKGFALSLFQTNIALVLPARRSSGATYLTSGILNLRNGERTCKR